MNMTTINIADITNAWIAAGSLSVFTPMDDEYYEVSCDFLSGAFSQALHVNLEMQKLLEYQEQSNDCDDYAVEAWAQMRRMHGRTVKKQGLEPHGIAFGIVIYTPAWGEGGAHMINWAMIGIEIVFYEPQQQRIVTLTREEIETTRCIIA